MVVEVLQQLRQFDIDQVQPEDAIVLGMVAKQLRAEYESLHFTVPEWLDDCIRKISRYLETKRRDMLELRLREAKARRATNMSREEKRAADEAEIAALEAQLSQTP